MESEIQIFREHHRCHDPQPSGKVNVFGGMECLSCGFEVVVAPWFSGPATAVSSPAEPSLDVETEYRAFLESKRVQAERNGFAVRESDLSPVLFPFQRRITAWAIERGRAAIFADTGLGKTLMQLAWSIEIARYSDGRVLILAPLAVAQQTVAEAYNCLNFPVKYVRRQSEADAWQGSVLIANYEMLEHFDASRFTGVVLDESSVLKAYSGKTKKLLISTFSNTPYRLCCTATPAPNDHMELGNHAQFLGIMESSEMLARWFINDPMTAGAYRLKKYAERDFWRWVASWAICATRPSDVGSEFADQDAAYELPELRFEVHTVRQPERAKESGKLFLDCERPSATNLWKDKAASAPLRCAQAAALVASELARRWLIWCETNDESARLAKSISGAIEVRGNDTLERKESGIARFLAGNGHLVSKSSICGFGLNFQHCHDVIFCGLTYSFEALYQAVRRVWRFGQKHPVTVHLITAESEIGVLDTINRKRAAHEAMQRAMVEATMSEHRESTGLTDAGHEIRRGEDWELHIGDCVEVARTLPDDSVSLTVSSLPFSNLYIYSDSLADMGNSSDDAEFFRHFDFLTKELYRLTAPGRLCCIHCKDLPRYMNRDGAAGLYDFPGDIIRSFERAGWQFHSRITIWKDPVTEMQRTKNHGLLHKNFVARREVCRQGMADYVLVFRAWKGEVLDGLIQGDTANGQVEVEQYIGTQPPTDTRNIRDYSIQVWQKYASPVWFDIDQQNVLQYREARSEEDERHICPLQLQVIERCIWLWSNPGEVVFDPFAGIGSTGYCALKMKRKTLAIELKPSYAEVAEKNFDWIIRERTQGVLFA